MGTVIGANFCKYEGREQCGGGGILGADEETALALPHLKLERVVLEIGGIRREKR